MDKIDIMANFINNSANIVFFGGAGVSTESGIPDFRSEKGLYAAREKYGRLPEEMISRSFFRNNTALFFQYYKENLIHQDASPNAAHLALGKLEKMGKLSAVLTQNIDGLHQAAGSQNVIELHGSNNRHYCIKCRKIYDLTYVMLPQNCDEQIPICSCGGIVRPDVVLYEENLDEDTWAAAIEAIRAADLLIVGGTSLVVYPAAGLINFYDEGALILINKEATNFDSRADLVIKDNIGEVFSDVMSRL